MQHILLLLFVFTAHLLSAQTKVFDMYVLGFKFGKLSVTKTLEPDSTEVYTMDAGGKATVLWIDFVSRTTQQVKYRHGRLVSSVYTEIENGKIKRWSKVYFDGDKYQVDSYSGKRHFTEVPRFSIAKLYFENTTGIEKIFYEAETNFAPVVHDGKGNLEIRTSDGNRSVYRFENGELKKMEFHISIATVYAVRVD